MWYVIQVLTGTEEGIKAQCEKRIAPEILQQCFIPYYEEKEKYEGTWHTLSKVLFPGYVFLITEQPEELMIELKKVMGMTKLLGTGNEIVPIKEKEQALLERLSNESHVVEISTGIMEGGLVRILEGPLQGMEATIRRIDRHKRKAWIEVEMFGRVMEMLVGCEIVEKR